MKISGIEYIYNFISKELRDFSLKEKLFYSVVVLSVLICSILAGDSLISQIYALCGISYTLLNGKRKIYCYFFGIISTICYCFLTFKNSLWGNFSLNLFYYLPIQIFGIYNWKKHFEKGLTVKKNKLNFKERIFYMVTLTLLTLICFSLHKIYKFSYLNLSDILVVCFSVIAMILAFKRCIEQWYLWTIVNLITITIWIVSYMNNTDYFGTILVWGIYLILGIYFYFKWRKEI